LKEEERRDFLLAMWWKQNHTYLSMVFRQLSVLKQEKLLILTLSVPLPLPAAAAVTTEIVRNALHTHYSQAAVLVSECADA